MSYFAKIKSAAQKRAAYRRTLAEIEALPTRVKADLDLDGTRASSMARQAVYG
ncbi:hypothetical protein [Celeribacter arenosi]|uniref:DUF1127 domain-containing protein n=1 Tax=Celeribacter arenosi TaxID=792649 RepID=A0ABP7KBM7_9RHOB